MNRFFTLLKIEGKLSLRGMDMIIFALCLPVVVVVILGFIYSDAPVFLAQSRQSLFVPAALWVSLWLSPIIGKKRF